jgi:hypothetical protein
MKKTISFTIIFLSITLVSFAQKKGNNAQKKQVIDCLCSYNYTQFGTYSFNKNGTFEYQQPKPYPLYKTGTWSYVSGNKVKINKTWLGKSSIVTIGEDCTIEW